MQEIIKQLVTLAKSYNPFAYNIDNYNKYVWAITENAVLRKKWNDICKENNIWIGDISCFANLGNKTEGKITVSLRRSRL